MASTYSTSLRLELIGQGEQSGTWGITTNNNFGALVEQAITGVQTISMSNASYTLSNFNGTVDEARNAVLVIAGTNLAPQNVVAPSVEKVYIINNQSGNTVTIKTSGGNGIGVTNNTTVQVYCDGTNFFSATPNINSVTGNFAATGNVTAGNNVTATSYLVGNALSVTGAGSVGTNFSVAGTTYTGALVNYGNQQVNGSENITGNLTVGGTITGSIAGLTGTIKQIVTSVAGAGSTTSSSSPVPTGHIANITPTAASSKILVMFYGAVAQPQYLGPETYALATMFRNGVQTNATVGVSVGSVSGALIAVTASGQAFSYVDSAGTTSLIQYQMYYNALGGGQCTYNDLNGATITLIEIGQ
jgi:hypothetical protein